MARQSNKQSNKYRVTGEDDSIYLSRTGKYLKKNEVVEFTPQEAEMLLVAKLIEPLKSEVVSDEENNEEK